ncbi:MAG: hypothetical protein AB8F95_10530, partial [Bacteroidia bacterium]
MLKANQQARIGSLSYGFPPIKRMLFLAILLIASMHVFSQNNTDLTYLADINEQRLKLNNRSMYVLGGWAVSNIALGTALRGKATGANRYFHEGNAAWNVVNLAIAGGSLLAGAKADPAAFDMFQTIAEQQKIEKFLLFNAGLDVGYMATGLYLMERGKAGVGKKYDRFSGYGKALLLQGGFLFAFDLTVFMLHNSQGSAALKQILASTVVTPEGIGLCLRF